LDLQLPMESVHITYLDQGEVYNIMW
jgi:hypothetical protein